MTPLLSWCPDSDQHLEIPKDAENVQDKTSIKKQDMLRHKHLSHIWQMGVVNAYGALLVKD